MTSIPQDPSGSSGLVQTIKQILRFLREQRLMLDPTLSIDRTSNGTKVTVVGVKGKGGGKDEMVWL